MIVDPRPTWDTYFLKIAEIVSDRADCRRRRHGALVVKDHRIVSTGYNGAPAGMRGCLDGYCPRGQLPVGEKPLGTTYDSGAGLCIAVHAEANALLYADRAGTEGAVLYLSSSSGAKGQPCMGCWRLIMGAGITRVVYWKGDDQVTIPESMYEYVLLDGGATEEMEQRWSRA